MLVDFEITNFLSFQNNTVLSLEKGKYLKRHAKSHIINKENLSLLKCKYFWFQWIWEEQPNYSTKDLCSNGSTTYR